MSRAFVRNSDADPEPLPDRPISPHLTSSPGADQAFRLVGEDEADAGAPASSAGRRRWHRRFLGRQPGESISFQGGEAEILGIEV